MQKDTKTKARQRALYETLERIASDSYVSQEKIIRMAEGYPSAGKGPFHDGAARRLLSRDIYEINENLAYPRIIVSLPGYKGVKLAGSWEEEQAYMDRQKAPCFQKLKHLAAIEEKRALRGQLDLDGNEHRVFPLQGETGERV